MCDDTPCDFTRPAPAGKYTPLGLRNAQYHLTGSPYINGKLMGAERIGGGFSLNDALALEKAMCRLIDRYFPEPRFFAFPAAGIELRLPHFSKNGNAQVGDLILRRFTTPLCSSISGDGSFTFIDTLIAGQVVRVDAHNKPVEVRDRTGVVEPENGYFIFPAAQFDLPAVLAEMERRDLAHIESGHFGPLHGHYDVRVFAFAMREYLIPEEAVLPTLADMRRIFSADLTEAEYLSVLEAYRPLPLAA